LRTCITLGFFAYGPLLTGFGWGLFCGRGSALGPLGAEVGAGLGLGGCGGPFGDGKVGCQVCVDCAGGCNPPSGAGADGGVGVASGCVAVGVVLEGGATGGDGKAVAELGGWARCGAAVAAFGAVVGCHAAVAGFAVVAGCCAAVAGCCAAVAGFGAVAAFGAVAGCCAAVAGFGGLAWGCGDRGAGVLATLVAGGGDATRGAAFCPPSRLATLSGLLG